jgi:hypothetical protein
MSSSQNESLQAKRAKGMEMKEPPKKPEARNSDANSR